MPDSIIHRFKRQAERYPAKPAYIFFTDEGRAETITFAALDRAAETRAAQLQALFSVGTPVVLCLPPGIEFKVSLLACLYAGLVIIPFPPFAAGDASKQAAALGHIFEDTQAGFILTTDELKPRIRLALQDRADAIKLISETDLPAATTWQAPKADLAAPLFCSYTSGTTGRPKGVIITQSNLLTSMEDIRADLDIRPHHALCTLFNHYHIITALWDLTLNCNGAQTLYLPIQRVLEKPVMLLKILSDYQVSLLMGVNLTLELCVNRVQEDELQGIDLSRLQLLVGGDKVKLELLDAFIQRYAAYGFRDTAIQSRYGQAEGFGFTSSVKGEYPRIESISAKDLARNAIASPRSEADRIDLVTSGTPLPSVTLRIVDPDEQVALNVRQPGEVWIKGGAVGKGYWNQAQKTAQAFGFYLKDCGDGPFLRTGDMGYLNERGELFLLGRLKERLSLNGGVYYPEPIEKTAKLAAAALSITISALAAFTAREGEALCIGMEVSPAPAAAVAETVREAVRKAVAAAHDLPVAEVLFFPEDTLPRTKTGKIQRNQCYHLSQGGYT